MPGRRRVIDDDRGRSPGRAVRHRRLRRPRPEAQDEVTGALLQAAGSLRRSAERVRLSARARPAPEDPPPSVGGADGAHRGGRGGGGRLGRRPRGAARGRRRRAGGAGTPPTTSTTTAPSDDAPVDGEPGAPGVGDPYYPEPGQRGLRRRALHARPHLAGRPGRARGGGHDRGHRHPGPEPAQPRPRRAGGPIGDRRRPARPSVAATDRELVIDPAADIAEGADFTTVVTYSGTPEPIHEGTDIFDLGWQTDGREAFVVSEPSGAQTFFPVSDHPTDKATYTIRVTAPEDQTVAANGLLVGENDTGHGTRSWTYEVSDPMASYLVQIAIGDYELVDAGRVRRRHRSATPSTGRWSTTRTEAQPRARRSMIDAARRRLRAVSRSRPTACWRSTRPSASRSRRRRSRSSAPTSPPIGPRSRPDPPARARAPVGGRRGEPGHVEGHLAERGLRHLRRVAVARAHRAGSARPTAARRYEGASELDLPPGDPGPDELFGGTRLHPGRDDAAGAARAGGRRRLLRDPPHVDRRAPRRHGLHRGLHRAGRGDQRRRARRAVPDVAVRGPACPTSDGSARPRASRRGGSPRSR